MNKILSFGLKSFLVLSFAFSPSLQADRRGGYGALGLGVGTLLGYQLGKGQTKTVVVEKAAPVSTDQLNQLWQAISELQTVVQSDLNKLYQKIKETDKEKEKLIEKVEKLTERLERLKVVDID